MRKKLQESTKAAKGKGKGKRKGGKGKRAEAPVAYGKRSLREKRKRRKGARGSRKKGKRKKLSQRKRVVKGTMKSKFATAHIAEKRKEKKCKKGPKGRRMCTKG